MYIMVYSDVFKAIIVSVYVSHALPLRLIYKHIALTSRVGLEGTTLVSFFEVTM